MTKFIQVLDREGNSRVLNVDEISRIDVSDAYTNRLRIVMKDGAEIEVHRDLKVLMAEINAPVVDDAALNLAGVACAELLSKARTYALENYSFLTSSASFTRAIKEALKL